MKDKYLSVGTVVMLKGGKKAVMITGYLAMSGEDNKEIYDYSSCLYPEGILSSDQTIVFNHEQIDKILHDGYETDEYKSFIEKIKQLVKENNIVTTKVETKIDEDKTEVLDVVTG